MELGFVAALALGALQGATEFLPVSSSGHVALGAWLFGVEHLDLATVVLVHGGTLIATLWVFRADLLSWLKSVRRLRTGTRQHDVDWTLLGTVVASVPTAAIALFLEPHVESWAQERSAVGIAFCATAVMLVFASRRRHGGLDRLSMLGCFVVGCAQGVAVIPGISRSGATIATAMLLGLRPEASFRFSFLCSFPAIAGALLRKATSGELSHVGPSIWLAGATALGVGWVCLLLLQRLVTQGKLWLFSVYLLPLGAGLVLWESTR